MLTKKIRHPYRSKEIHDEPIVLILGFFDGVHRGHQKVISEGVKIAKDKGLKSAVMTFNRYPGIVYKKIDYSTFGYLTTNDRKGQIIDQLGVDYLYEIAFTSKFGSLSPQAFVDQYIVSFNTQVVVAGFDYTYGKREVANMELLPKYSKDRFEVISIPEQTDEAEKISSTRIRQALRTGHVQRAANLLGYYYQTPGYVVHGDARGRELGYPTANIKPTADMITPKVGVYAVQIQIDGTWYDGMASIGYNITFKDGRDLSIEVNIFNFEEQIYGEDILVKWVEYLRAEEKYDSTDALIQQLDKDQLESQAILKNMKDYSIV